MYTGPHIIKDGLVVGYDTGYGVADNTTPTRFYPGKSTTNLLTSSGATSLDVRSDIYNNVTKTDLGNGKYRFVNDGTGSTTIRVYVNLNDLVDGQYYGCSVSYEELNAGGYIGLDWCDTTYTAFTQASYGSANRIHIYGARSTYDSTFRFLDISLPVNGSVVLFDAQVELGPPSPFVDGSRSSTASLIDLKETTNIDVSNITFDSTGQPEMDGSSDYVDLGADIEISPINQGWTAEYVFNSDSASTLQHFNGCEEDVHNAGWLALYQSKLQVWNRDPGTWRYGSTVFASNTWYHVAFVQESGTSMQFYVNGVAEGGNHTSYSWNASKSAFFARYIGRYEFSGYSRYFNGHIPVARLYSKPLTAAEIKQNYNAYKNRFDI